MGAPSVWSVRNRTDGSKCNCQRQSPEPFAPVIEFARDGSHGDAFRRRDVLVQRNFPTRARVVGTDMITSAIVFGMVGVAAGFTWDYVVNRGK